jgi:hypothetical protein
MFAQRRARYGISTIMIIATLFFILSATAYALTFTGYLSTNSPTQTTAVTSTDLMPITLEEATKDLNKNGYSIVEVDTKPQELINQKTVTSYFEFKKIIKQEKQIFCYIESDTCNLFFEKEGLVYTWTPSKWEKLKINKVECITELPGWKICFEIKNSGNLPIEISSIKVEGYEISNNNYYTNDYVSFSTSCDSKKGTILNPKENITFNLRISNYYKYTKPDKPIEVEFISSSGYTVKKIIILSK